MKVCSLRDSGFNNLFVVDDFISEEEARFWTSILSNNVLWDTTNADKGNGSFLKINPLEVHPEASGRFDNLILNTSYIIEELFEEPFVVQSYPSFRKFSSGDGIGWHYDSSYDSDGQSLGIGLKQNNHTATIPIALTDVSTILYYNNDFSGGHLWFRSSAVESIDSRFVQISPHPGKLVIFPSTPKYGHGVSTVLSGERFISANFWSRARTIAISMLDPLVDSLWRQKILWPEKIDSMLGCGRS